MASCGNRIAVGRNEITRCLTETCPSRDECLRAHVTQTVRNVWPYDWERNKTEDKKKCSGFIRLK